ncbi:TetR/AcrR family transcriptional regulator [Rhodovarius crocodyli]|uniref:TetR/AcrR family transcriptional regulator n=1 Tax=Rhodovarius crocodyli TaxID=1979269 RepID=A0A437MEA3_9PROT|nr:TetR family transcriptional regulator [Rhodovarius crocodyli]RVT95956.1 TetR/AcrR family transcriptional regulator [Rhodovarius crocodyli]
MTAPSTAEATRARIADTAEALFRSMGYQKTAVADIARALGMSPANVYRFFPSKSAINEAICTRLLSGISARIEAEAEGAGTAEQRLNALTHELLKACLEVFFTEKRMHDMVAAAMEEHWSSITQFLDRLVAALRRCVADGMASGEFAPGDPEQMALVLKVSLLAFYHPQLIEDCLNMPEPSPDLAQSLDLTLALLVAGLKRGLR